jgi:hypothetical protein
MPLSASFACVSAPYWKTWILRSPPRNPKHNLTTPRTGSQSQGGNHVRATHKIARSSAQYAPSHALRHPSSLKWQTSGESIKFLAESFKVHGTQHQPKPTKTESQRLQAYLTREANAVAPACDWPWGARHSGGRRSAPSRSSRGIHGGIAESSLKLIGEASGFWGSVRAEAKFGSQCQ